MEVYETALQCLNNCSAAKTVRNATNCEDDALSKCGKKWKMGQSEIVNDDSMKELKGERRWAKIVYKFWRICVERQA